MEKKLYILYINFIIDDSIGTACLVLESLSETVHTTLKGQYLVLAYRLIVQSVFDRLTVQVKI